MPIAKGQHHRFRRCRAIVCRREPAPNSGTRAERSERAIGDFEALDLFGLGGSRDAGGTARPHADLLKRSVLVSIGERSEEHTSELQSHLNLVCRLLLEKKKQPA